MLDINESVGVSSAFFWAVVSISGLLVGSLIGIKVPLSHRSIARTMALAAGMCGSVSGSVPTSVGQPALKVDNILVGGNA